MIMMIMNIPDDVIRYIMDLLDYKAICQFAQSCQTTSQLIFQSSESFWVNRLSRDYQIKPYDNIGMNAQQSYQWYYEIEPICQTIINNIHEKTAYRLDPLYIIPFIREQGATHNLHESIWEAHMIQHGKQDEDEEDDEGIYEEDVDDLLHLPLKLKILIRLECCKYYTQSIKYTHLSTDKKTQFDTETQKLIQTKEELDHNIVKIKQLTEKLNQLKETMLNQYCSIEYQLYQTEQITKPKLIIKKKQ
jgi:hypothetical protein